MQIASSTDALVTTAVGQANLTALDGLINSLMIMVPLGTYSDLIMNPFNGGTSAGPVTVTVVTNDGIFNFSQTLEPGENLMTLKTANGERI